MSTKDPVLVARSAVARASRKDRGTPHELEAARQELSYRKVQRATLQADPPLTTDSRTRLIQDLVAQAPPLTSDQADRIVNVLRGGAA